MFPRQRQSTTPTENQTDIDPSLKNKSQKSSITQPDLTTRIATSSPILPNKSVGQMNNPSNNNAEANKEDVTFKVVKYPLDGSKPLEYIDRDVPVTYNDGRLLLSCMFNGADLKSRYIGIMRNNGEDESYIGLVEKTERTVLDLKIKQQDFSEKAVGPYICGLIDGDNLVKNKTIYLSLKLPVLSQACYKDNDCRMVINSKCDETCNCKTWYKQNDTKTECSFIFYNPIVIIIVSLLLLTIIILTIALMTRCKRKSDTVDKNDMTTMTDVNEAPVKRPLMSPPQMYPYPIPLAPPMPGYNAGAQANISPNADAKRVKGPDVKGKNVGIKTAAQEYDMTSYASSEYDDNYEYDYSYDYIPPERDISFYYVDPFYIAPFQGPINPQLQPASNMDQGNMYNPSHHTAAPYVPQQVSDGRYQTYPFLNPAMGLTYLPQTGANPNFNFVP